MDPEGDTEALMSSSTVWVAPPCTTFSSQRNVEIRPFAPHDDPALPLMICTAVPYSMMQATSDTSSLGSITLDAPFETDTTKIRQEVSCEADTMAPSFSLTKYQSLGFLAGFMVGSFIQLSSLGANYLLTELYHDTSSSSSGYEMDIHGSGRTAHVLGFSLLWSTLTSFMGVMVLLILRSLVTLAACGSGHTQGNSDLSSKATLLMHLEMYFAVGTLIGVCLSWTCTDVWMGLRGHSVQSLITLAAALVWCKFVARCCFSTTSETHASRVSVKNGGDETEWDEETDGYNPSRPLLSNSEIDDEEEYMIGQENDEHGSGDLAQLLDLNLFKYESVVLGILIGFFIQFSSLGANFLLSDYKLHDEKATYFLLWAVDITDDHRSALWFSLIWSTVTSGMGVVILLIVRSLVKLVYKSRSSSRANGIESAMVLLHDAMLQLECGFAVGALVGVNVSWVLTDLILNLHVQYLHSVLTLVLALVWCKSASSCLIRSEGYSDEDNVDEEGLSYDEPAPLLERSC